MSAFVVGHDHIDALITFAIERRVCFYNPKTKSRNDINDDTATAMGKVLLAENERSVGYRYKDSDLDSMPGTEGETSRNYRYREWQDRLTPVAILKACSCFDYQACETEDYDDSLAYIIIEAIRSKAIGGLTGYEDAPGWEFRRKPLTAVA